MEEASLWKKDTQARGGRVGLLDARLSGGYRGLPGVRPGDGTSLKGARAGERLGCEERREGAWEEKKKKLSINKNRPADIEGGGREGEGERERARVL